MTHEQSLPPHAERHRATADVNVFASRTFAEPADPAATRRNLEPAHRSLLQRNLHPLGALLSCDGRRLLWHLRGPGPEAVSVALWDTPLARARLWPVRLHDLHPELSPNVVVEHLLGRFPSKLSDLARELQRFCLATHRVVPVRLAVSYDGRHALAFYRAPDAESVRLTQRHADVPVGHAWTFDVLI